MQADLLCTGPIDTRVAFFRKMRYNQNINLQVGSIVGLIALLEQVYLFVYCLPLVDLVMIAVYCTLIICTLYRRFAGQRRLRSCLCLTLGTWFAVVIWATLLQRDVSDAYDIRWFPLHSYLEVLTGGNPEIFRANLMNMALFYPAGLLFSGLMFRKRSFRSGMLRAVALFGLFSLAIELCQLLLHCGFCEIDDVLHNTLGAGLGFAAFRLFLKNTGFYPTIALE